MIEPRPSDATSSWPLYLAFFVSGCAALIYEVMWARSFALVFGGTTRAAAVVLAAYFLGMALGNRLGGRLSAATRAASLRWYAGAEIAVAVGALLVLAWLRAYAIGYPALYRATFSSPHLLVALQLSLAVLALGPPCIALGATLPLMSRAVVAGEAHLGRRLGFAYALNTFGGVVGVLLSGFWLPVSVGVRGSVLVAVALDGVAALAAFAAARRHDGSRPALAAAGPEVRPLSRTPLPLLLVAATSGLGTLALEVLFTRLLVNAMDSSVFSFAIVLASFLVSLAIGSLLVSAIVDRLGSAWTLVATSSTLAALAILLAPSLCTRVWQPSPISAWPSPAIGAAWQLLATSLLVIGPPAALVGMVLPAIWRAAIARVDEAGPLVGRLTSWNTSLGVIGSLVTGFVVIPLLGVGRGILIVAALYAAAGVLGWLQSGASRARGALAIGAALGFLAIASLRTWDIVPIVTAGDETIVALDESEDATVAVTSTPQGTLRLRSNSRYVLGGTVGTETSRGLGEFALTLHGAPRDVAFIGVATGMSLSSILSFSSVEHATAIELLPGVLRLAAFFRSANGGVLDDPRVEVLVADGRNHLAGTDRRFDAIVGDLFVPWHAGTGALYSTEHFAAVSRRLREGGVFAQWLQGDQASLAEVQSLAGSFVDAFPDAELWLNSREPGRPLLAFVGFRGRTPTSSDVRRIGDALRVCGARELREWTAAAPRNTDDVPWIEFSAAAGHRQLTPRDTQALLAALSRLHASDRPSS